MMPTSANANSGNVQALPEKKRAASGRFLIWFVVLGFCGFAFMSNLNWKATPSDLNAVWLPTVVFILLVGVLGLAFLFKCWDRKVQRPSGWNTWSVLFAIAFAGAGVAFEELSLASAGLLACLWAFCFTHHRLADSKHGVGGTLGSFALVGFTFVSLPFGWGQVALEGMAYGVTQAAQFVLSVAQVPFQFSQGTFLLESGAVEFSAFRIDMTFRALLLVTLLWVGRFDRSWLALPAYLVAVVLWTMTVGLTELVYVCTAGTEHQMGIGLVAVTVLSLVFACLLMVSTDRLLRVLLYEVPLDSPARSNNPVNHWWNSLFQNMTLGESASLSEANS